MRDNFDRENFKFISDLMNKGSFMLDLYEGAVLPKTHPNYYEGRIDISIRKSYNNYYGNINFGKDEYELSSEVGDKLYDYVKANIDKLIKISLNQDTEMYEGGVHSLFIKFNSICVNLSGVNASSFEEKNEIKKIEDDIKNIILDNSKLKDSKTIDDETIKSTIEEIFGTKDIFKNNILYKLIIKIVDMPSDLETSIAKLMDFDNSSVAMVEPSVQGELYNSLMKVCEKLNINIEEIRDGFGGLGYHYKFKKLDKKLDESLKLSNGKYAADQETKEAFEKYMEEVKAFNEKVERGEDPGITQGDLLAKYREMFYDESLEVGLKRIDDKFKSIEEDHRIDDLIKKIDYQLEELKKKEEKEELLNSIPESLRDYVYVVDGKVYGKQKLPKELEHEYEEFERKMNLPKCPICGSRLMFMMPSGSPLYCDKCKKYFENNNGTAGKETSYPYTDPNAIY